MVGPATCQWHPCEISACLAQQGQRSVHQPGDAPVEAGPGAKPSPGAKGAVLVAVVGLICLALEPVAPWIMLWPDALTLPISDWIGAGLGAVLGVFKPVARGFSAVLGVPMGWATQLLQIIPWPLFLSGVVALGWYLGGWRMALFAILGGPF